MASNRDTGPKDRDRGPSVGRRSGRNTTFEAPAYDNGRQEPVPAARLEPDATGIASNLEDFAEDSFHQPTAMLDKAELLGELAELNEGVPDTRAAVATEAPPKGFRLIVVAGPEIGLEWAFKIPEITIGRGTENEIDFSDIAVSRHHARVVQDGSQFFLVDLGSNNGTLLNGERVDGRQELSSGDEIVIGARTLRFVELDEAPSTAAAHPINEPAPEPVVGSPSEISPVLEAKEGPGGASQVDVGVVPEEDGPKGSAAEVPVPDEAKTKRLGVRMVLAVVIALGVVGGLSFAGWTVYQRIHGRGEQARQLEAKREFLEGIELVKAQRFSDALALFNTSLAVRPEYTRAKEYKAHCEKEIQTQKLLEAAKRLAAAGKPDEAIAWIKDLDPDSAYFPEAEKLRQQWAHALAEKRLTEARARYASGEVDAAMDLVIDALRSDANLADAQAFRDQIDDMRRAPEPEKKKVVSRIPPEMFGAVELYRADRIPAAIDAAEAAGGPKAAQYVEKMKKVKTMLADAAAAHKAKAAGELLKLGPAALELDKWIGEGTGKVRDRIKGYYADGLYLKGLEAYQDEDYQKSFQLLNEAVKTVPDHHLALERLEEMNKKAKQLFFDGSVLKDSNPAEARKIMKRIVQMTKPDNAFHQKAAKFLGGQGG